MNNELKGKTCKVKGNSTYFAKKYGTPNPTIKIEDLQTNVMGKSWMDTANPACYLYALRVGTEKLPIDDDVYYGKIQTKIGAGLGELVHVSELEVIK